MLGKIHIIITATSLNDFLCPQIWSFIWEMVVVSAECTVLPNINMTIHMSVYMWVNVHVIC